MSCCYKDEVVTVPVQRPNNNCICNFPTLIILILIVLQFSKNKKNGDGECEGWGGKQQVGNGVLFIIALFFLSCVGCGKGNY